MILELLFRYHHSSHCLQCHYYTSTFGHHSIQVHLVRSCSVEEVESRQFWLSSCPSGSSLTHSGCLRLDSPAWSSIGPFLHPFRLHLRSSLHCCWGFDLMANLRNIEEGEFLVIEALIFGRSLEGSSWQEYSWAAAIRFARTRCCRWDRTMQHIDCFDFDCPCCGHCWIRCCGWKSQLLYLMIIFF